MGLQLGKQAQTIKKEFTISGSSIKECEEKATYLKKIIVNLDHESLRIVATKAMKPGMNRKLKTYQHLI